MGPRGVLLRIIFLAQLIVLALVARQWAYVTTYRLYLDHALSGRQPAVTQRFDVESGRVVPRIATREAARVSFRADFETPATIRSEIEPAVPVHYEVAWRAGGRRQLLAAGVAVGRT